MKKKYIYTTPVMTEFLAKTTFDEFNKTDSLKSLLKR